MNNPWTLPVTYISNQAELQSIRAVGYYKLRNDITLDANFQPLDNLPGAFDRSGVQELDLVLDGDGFSIIGFSYTVPPNSQEPVGLFRKLSYGSIINLTLKNVSISHAAPAVNNRGLGAFVGETGDQTCLDNVHAVNGSLSGIRSIGGLVGVTGVNNKNGGYCHVRYSSSNLSVSGTSIAVGGLVGLLITNGNIFGSSFCGDVSCNPKGGESNVGGIVGDARGWIDSCFSEGTVINFAMDGEVKPIIKSWARTRHFSSR